MNQEILLFLFLSDKCTYCKSLWIKASAKCPERQCKCFFPHHGGRLLTLQSDAVHGEGPGQLGGHLHAAADQGLSEHVLEGLVKGGAVAQLADHRDGILGAERRTSYELVLRDVSLRKLPKCTLPPTFTVQPAHQGLKTLVW